MKLLYTPNSPYARIARVCALHQRLEIPFEQVTVREKADRILDYNPAGIVPTLVLDSGAFLTETRLICEYFETLGPGGFLAESDDLDARHWEGFTHNFLDGVAVWVRELRRPADEQSPGTLKLEESRSNRCLEYLEDRWNTGATELNFAATALASAIELLDTRITADWRNGHPKLAAWYAQLSANNLLRLTAPHPV